jgi:hypothetical protein
MPGTTLDLVFLTSDGRGNPVRLRRVGLHAMFGLACARMLVNLAELPGKGQLLFAVDRLIAKEQHAMPQQQRLDVIPSFVL